MFDDRRNFGERRNRVTRDDVPVGGCRRNAGERRHLLRQYHPQPWWLQANYVEEVQPPVLANQLRRQRLEQLNQAVDFPASTPRSVPN